MRKLVSAVLATVIAASSLTGLSAARDRDGDRGHRDRQTYVTSYCAQNPRARDCQDWQRNGRNWNDNNYRGFYERNHGSNQDAALAALFGIIVGGVVIQGGRDDDRGYRNNRRSSRHERACANAYRSYDRRTDTYIGRDGRRRECRL
jgi:hypothetical protein